VEREHSHKPLLMKDNIKTIPTEINCTYVNLTELSQVERSIF
jgi:hypothetical protein